MSVHAADGPYEFVVALELAEVAERLGTSPRRHRSDRRRGIEAGRTSRIIPGRTQRPARDAAHHTAGGDRGLLLPLDRASPATAAGFL